MKTDKEIAVEFLTWCNKPTYRNPGELGFKPRVVAQFPEYELYLIMGETGNSVLPRGKFLTAEELFDFWIENC